MCLVKQPSVDFRWTSLMISQYWFRYLLGAIRHQAILCVNGYPDPHRQMASLGHMYMLFPQNMHMVIALLHLPWDVTGRKYILLSARSVSIWNKYFKTYDIADFRLYINGKQYQYIITTEWLSNCKTTLWHRIITLLWIIHTVINYLCTFIM